MRKPVANLTVSCALGLLCCMSSAQQANLRENLNRETFSEAPLAPKQISDAVLKFQANGDPFTADDVAQMHIELHALRISFGPPNEVDYAVTDNGMLTGADNDWFWLVRDLPSGPKVVLWLHCLNFEFDRTRTNGFLSVTNEWNSPNEVIEETFRFNGQRYVCIRRSEKPFKVQ